MGLMNHRKMIKYRDRGVRKVTKYRIKGLQVFGHANLMVAQSTTHILKKKWLSIEYTRNIRRNIIRLRMDVYTLMLINEYG